MSGRFVALAVAAAAGIAALSLPARADMGTAPVGPDGTYLSFEGGYLHHDSDGATGHGVVANPGDPIRNVFVSPDDGYFVGGLIGYENGKPFLFDFHRVELYLFYGDLGDESRRDAAPPNSEIVLKSVDGTVLVRGGGVVGKTTVERETWEGALRFEDDDVVDAKTTVTWVFAPFIRYFDESTSTLVGTCGGGVPCEARRGGDVDNWLYGVYIAAEPEHWLTPSLALVGRLGVGVYGYDSDGSFRSSSSAAPDVFLAAASGGDSGVGFRGLLGIGLKFKLSSNSRLEAFGEADYFSDVGVGAVADNVDPGPASYVDTEDLWELRAGLRLTFGFGPPPN